MQTSKPPIIPTLFVCYHPSLMKIKHRCGKTWQMTTFFFFHCACVQISPTLTIPTARCTSQTITTRQEVEENKSSGSWQSEPEGIKGLTGGGEGGVGRMWRIWRKPRCGACEWRTARVKVPDSFSQSNLTLSMLTWFPMINRSKEDFLPGIPRSLVFVKRWACRVGNMSTTCHSSCNVLKKVKLCKNLFLL